MIKPTFWRAIALIATLILAGCSSSQPEQQGRPQAWLEPGTRVTLPLPDISPPINSQQLLTTALTAKPSRRWYCSMLTIKISRWQDSPLSAFACSL